jgi:hypothetical protein
VSNLRHPIVCDLEGALDGRIPMVSNLGMTAAHESLTMSEAARVLGYGRSRIYGLKTELNAAPDPRTGALRVSASAVEAYRLSPPPRRRPLPPDTTPASGLHPPTAMSAATEANAASPAASSSSGSRAAERAVARYNALQDELIAAEDEARDLEARAAVRRTEARRTLRKLRRAHAAAMEAFAERQALPS